MKKIINNPGFVVQEMLEGIVKAHSNLKKLEGFNVIVRADGPVNNKVALISGGGSGHEPSHAGFVGLGMLDGAIAGEVFTSPTPDQILEAIKAVNGNAGVLMIVKNYTGDVMNFEMAGELAKNELNLNVDYVVVNDDVAVENSTWTTGRRGIAGTVFVHKISGAAAEKGYDLPEVKRVALKTIENVRSMGMSLTPCIVPAAGKPSFTLAEDEMEIGLGIHGEPGTHREKIKTADEITEILLNKILEDLDYSNGEVAVMINGLGGTPLMELYIMNRKVHNYLESKGIKIYKTYIGNYMTSLEMAGASITLLKLDDELKTLLDAPAKTPAFTQF